MDRLYEHIASEVEAKPVATDDDVAAKFEVLMDYYTHRTSNFAKATESPRSCCPRCRRSAVMFAPDNFASQSLALVDDGRSIARLGPDLGDATDYARAEKAPATRRAYRSDFELFRAWCDAKDVLSMPAWPETVSAFLASEANRGVKASTIGRRMAAIRYAHKLAGHEPPTNSEAVKATMRGIRRTIGGAPERKTPATATRSWR